MSTAALKPPQPWRRYPPPKPRPSTPPTGPDVYETRFANGDRLFTFVLQPDGKIAFFLSRPK